MQSVLVTGATGCVGRAVLKRARFLGWSVRGLARGAEPAWWPDDAQYVRTSVEDPDGLMRAVGGCNAVVHLASPVHDLRAWKDDQEALRRTTVDGTANVARAAKAARARLVLLSTIAVYGTPPASPCDETTPVRPTTAYGRAKLDAEEQAQLACDMTSVLRSAVVYGPGDRGNVRRLIDAARRGRALVIGRGANRKSLVFSENLADRVLACLEVQLSGIWCVADAPAPSQRTLMHVITRALGRPAPPSVPLAMALGAARVADLAQRVGASSQGTWSTSIQTLASETVTNGSALDRALGYRPRISLEEGMALTVAAMVH